MRSLFSGATFNINAGERIGLVGRNGAGKTTLMRILSGLDNPTSGTVNYKRNIRKAFLEQEKSFSGSQTIYEIANSAFVEFFSLQNELTIVENEIHQRTDYESESFLRLSEKLAYLNERIHDFSDENREEAIERVLTGLGYSRQDFHRPISEFSGGWQMRVEIARLLLSKPDFLLLDEPTNHLDIESIIWLEEYLQRYRGAVMLVSHDRTFLDNVCTRTIEINAGKVYDYRAPYSEFLVLREEMLEQQMKMQSEKLREIEKIEKFVERFRYKATKAKQVQSRLKQLERIEFDDLDDFDRNAIVFTFPPAPHSGNIVIEAQGASKTYDRQIFAPVDFIVPKGEKIAFIGKNGMGKSTLVKMIMGEIDFDGMIKLGHQVIPAYFSQNETDKLDSSLSVYETIEQYSDNDTRPKLRNILGRFLFRGDDVEKKVSILSGGEKTRLALACLLIRPFNLLILDEPTNHLDLLAKDVLKSALFDFEGTLIIVSHDRDFLSGLTNSIFEFKDGNIRQLKGDISEYFDKLALQRGESIKVSGGGNIKDNSDSKIKYEQKKQENKELKKLQNTLTRIENEIHDIENKMLDISSMLNSTNDYEEITKLSDEYTKLEINLSEQYRNWEKIQELLE